MEAVFANHPSAELFFLICAIFLLGCIECFVFKQPNSAYINWLFCICCAAALVIHPPTPIRVFTGIGVFVSGITVMYLFDRGRLRKGSASENQKGKAASATASSGPHELIKDIKTREDLVNFIRALKDDYEKEGSDWENNDIGRFLEALAAWTNSMDGYYKNHGMPIPETPSWKTIADMLIAATMQE